MTRVAATVGLVALLALAGCDRKPSTPPAPGMNPSTQTGNPKGVFTDRPTGDVAAPGARPSGPGESSTSAGSTPDVVGVRPGSQAVPGGGLPPAPLAGSSAPGGGGAGR
jgi:hypothetical protein